MISPRLRRRLRSLAWRCRFTTAAVCCGLAAAGTVHALRPPPPPTSPVVVAAHALGPGTVLTASDLDVARLPPAHVPVGAACSVDDLVGRTTAAVVTAGLPLVDGQVHDGGPAASAPAGTVVVPVRLDPAVAALLSPGDRVDLLATDATASGTADPGVTGEGPSAAGASAGTFLARSALVLPVPDREEDGLPGSRDASGIVLVAVLPEDGERIATRGVWEETSAVLVR